MTIKAKDFDRLVQKLGFETRDSGDRLAWLVHEGKILARTRRSHMKGGNLPFQHSIRQQLHLNQEELNRFLDCEGSREDYISLLRKKGFA